MREDLEIEIVRVEERLGGEIVIECRIVELIQCE